MDYKKIIKNRNVRFKILRLFDFLPDRVMLKLQYRIKLNRKLNINNPKRFTEKLQLYKMYYRNDILHVCVDKYKVRSFVESKGLKNILPNFYGLFDNVDEIDFMRLPNKFVMKCTDGGGGLNVMICNDKSKMNIQNTKKILLEWLSHNKIYGGREWAYNGLQPKIIIEEYLEDESCSNGIFDYKFFCFNGVPYYIVLDGDRFTGHKRNFYDINWNKIEVSSDCPNFDRIIPKPEGLSEMIRVAKILAVDFDFVRVDLYYVNKKVYFGELTFYPWSGYVKFNPDFFDYELGSKFKIEKIY